MVNLYKIFLMDNTSVDRLTTSAILELLNPDQSQDLFSSLLKRYKPKMWCVVNSYITEAEELSMLFKVTGIYPSFEEAIDAILEAVKQIVVKRNEEYDVPFYFDESNGKNVFTTDEELKQYVRKKRVWSDGFNFLNIFESETYPTTVISDVIYQQTP